MEDSKSKKRRRSRSPAPSRGGDDKRSARGGRARPRRGPGSEQPRREQPAAEQVAVDKPGAEQPHVSHAEANAGDQGRPAARSRRERGGAGQRNARRDQQPGEDRREESPRRLPRGSSSAERAPEGRDRQQPNPRRRSQASANEVGGDKSAFGANDQIPDFLRRPVKRKPEQKSEPQTADN